MSACVGWIRYKPLLLYITNREGYADEIQRMRQTLSDVLPKLAQHFGNDGFLKIIGELEEYQHNVKKHFAQFTLAQDTWKKLVDTIENKQN